MPIEQFPFDAGLGLETAGAPQAEKTPQCRHGHGPVVTPGDLFGAMTWRTLFQTGADDLVAPEPAVWQVGGLLGGGAQFVEFDFGIGGGGTVHAHPPRGDITRGLSREWRNAIVEALSVLARSGPGGRPAAQATRQENGQWVIDFQIGDQTLPGRSAPELTSVSVMLAPTPAGEATYVSAITLTDAANRSLALPFRELTLGEGTASLRVRVPTQLPSTRRLLGNYLPNLPSHYQLWPQGNGDLLMRFASDVGLGQEIALVLAPGLDHTLAVTHAQLVEDPPKNVPATTGGAASADDPGDAGTGVHARFKLAANVDSCLRLALRRTAVGIQLHKRGCDVSVRTLVLRAQQTGVEPRCEILKGKDEARHVWTFDLCVPCAGLPDLHFSLKVRTIDRGQGVADVVDARLVEPVPHAQQGNQAQPGQSKPPRINWFPTYPVPNSDLA